MGFTYNLGRGFAAIAPFVVGVVADGSGGFTAAFLLLAAAYLGAALLAALLPDAEPRDLAGLAAPAAS
jgi:cyanate permease